MDVSVGILSCSLHDNRGAQTQYPVMQRQQQCGQVYRRAWQINQSSVLTIDAVQRLRAPRRYGRRNNSEGAMAIVNSAVVDDGVFMIIMHKQKNETGRR